MRAELARLGRTSGAVLALDHRNGEILALISFPSFDSNVFVDPTRTRERGAILTDPHRALFNRAVSGSYSPGSTIKPLVGLAALAEGVLTPETEILSTGALEIPNPYQPDRPSRFLDWKAHGWVTLQAAIARSSNILFYLSGGGLPQGVPRDSLIRGSMDLGGLGIATLKSYWQKFGFGAQTGVDLPGEGTSFLPDAAEKQARTGEPWRIGDSYNASIGQGDFRITPLQLLSFIASIGNGGRIYRPFVRLGKTPEVVTDYGAAFAEELKIIRAGMEDGVNKSYGTSHALSDLPFTVAGKTGTPQIANKTKVNAFFVGYAPAPRPEIALLILVEDAVEGSLNTIPIAHDALKWYYDNRIAKLPDPLAE
jgi:penicillin-binding protein 2